MLYSCIDLQKRFAVNLSKLQQDWPETDFSRKSIDLTELFYPGFERDYIPAIDKPNFENTQSLSWLHKREPVILVELNGEVKVYPLQILIHHEIVNDEIGGTKVAVTFCPLCNSAIVFKREIGGELLSFGVSGALRKSDLIMYDRQSQSWWQQFTGEAIIGKYTGTWLEQISAQIVAFEEIQKHYPEALVLSRETGYSKLYGSNPFRGYDSVDESPFLFFDPVDPRLPAMERVLAVSVESKDKVYPESILQTQGLVQDLIGTTPIVAFSQSDVFSAVDEEWIDESRYTVSAAAFHRVLDEITLEFELREGKVVDTKTGSTWTISGRAVSGPLRGKRLKQLDQGVHFAFAWFAFKPQSQIYVSHKR